MPENDLFDIKKRINAATQTSKITRTMELIASSRLQRGKILLANYLDWFNSMKDASKCLPDSYFESPENLQAVKKKAYIIFGGGKGLSGAYSPNLLQYARPIVPGHDIIAVGSAAEAAFPDSYGFFPDDLPSLSYAKSIARKALDLYESEEVQEVYMLYTKGLKHVSDKLFPLARPKEYDSAVIIEPPGQIFFPVLFEEYSASVVYEAQLHAFISEQVARVTAMDSATKNADDIVENLQARYNRIRQSRITQEIIELSNVARGDG